MAAKGSEKAFCVLTFHYCFDVCRITKGAHIEQPVRYVTKTWSVVPLNKKYIYYYLKCLVYDKLLKPRKSFRIALYTAEQVQLS